MRDAWLVLAGLLAISAPAQGLALVGSGDAGIRVQVENGSLQAAARGNISLEGEGLGDDLEPIETDTGEWRGLANVTTLAPTGEGWLVLADARSGLLVPISEDHPRPNGSNPRNGTAASEETATAGEPDPSSGNDTSPSKEDTEEDRANRSTETTTSSPTTTTPESAKPPARGTAKGPADTDRGPGASTEESQEGGLPVDPAVLVLSLLFAGAFAVERFLGTDEGEDPIEGLSDEP